MAITMPAVGSGYFTGGRNLTVGHRYFSNSILQEILAAARVDLQDHDSRISVVEGLIAGMDPKASVDLCTAGALNAYTQAGAGVGATLTQNAAAIENIDGVAVVVGDRILVNNDGTVTGADRGIYEVTTVGTGAVKQVLTRTTDADTGTTEVSANMFVWVERGTSLADTAWVLTTNDPITVDTTALSFSEFTLSAHALSHERGGDLEIDGDHLDIDFTPSNYTPATTPAEAANVDDLAAHLYGIDVVAGDHETRLVAAEASLVDHKVSVRVATAAALNAYTQAGAGVGATLTANAVGVENIDGVALNLNDRVLVNNDGTVTAVDRGIYTVTAVGDGVTAQVLTRATDADQDAEVTSEMFVRVEEGTVYGGASFALETADPITVDTTALSFALIDTTTHAADHERAGLLEIDGDHLDIDFTPVHYTPSTAPAEAADVDDLAAHLQGLDDAIANRSHKQPVRLATAAALGAYTQAGAGVGATLTQNVAAVENIDGVAVVLGDRILVKNGAAGADNGIYTVTTVGTGGVQQVLTRATDADEDDELICGTSVAVEEGTANAGLRFKLTTANPITVDTTALTFQQHDAFAPVANIADVGGAAAAGSADTYARGDHVHKLANLVTLMAHEGSANVAGNAAAAGTVGTHRTVDYDDGGAVVDEEYAWESRMPAHYGGGTMNVKLYFVGAAAAGDVKWNVQFERMNLNGLDIDAGDSYDTAKTVTETVPGTAGQITTADFTFTSAEADDVVADELFRVLVQRDSNDAADTMVGDASLLAIEISQ